MTARLRENVGNGDPVGLVDHGLYGADAWVSEINTAAGIPAERREGLTAPESGQLDAVIPARYVGDSATERRDAWAEDMARKVRMSYPTQVVAHMIETDEGGLGLPGDGDRATTATLLKSCAGQGFRLGE